MSDSIGSKMDSVWKYDVLQFSGSFKTTTELSHIQLCAHLTEVKVLNQLFFVTFEVFFWC